MTIKNYNNFSIFKKINNIINNSPTQGGPEFFDNLDNEIKKTPEFTLEILDQIYKKYGYEFNLVSSGGYGKYLLDMLKSKKIKCNGSILILSGSLTSHKGFLNKITPDKKIYIVYSQGVSDNKKFIFVDDSYYSGSTLSTIAKYLKTINSDIIDKYVIYDGSDKKIDKLNSLYKYYDHNNGRILSKEDLISKLYKIKNYPIEVEKEILSGKIKTNRDLIKQINQYTDTKIDIYKFNYLNQL